MASQKRPQKSAKRSVESNRDASAASSLGPLNAGLVLGGAEGFVPSDAVVIELHLLGVLIVMPAQLIHT